MGGPCAGGVGGDAGEEHFSGGDVDEEQQVVAAQQGGVDGGEVTRDGGLGAQELGPRDSRSVRCRLHAVAFEDPPHGRRSDAVTKTGEFAVDAAVAPGRVVRRHVDDEPANLSGGGRPSWSFGGLGPVAGDAPSVPPQQSVGRDEPAGASWSGERGGDRAEQGPVVVVELGPVVLSAKHHQLVTQHDDLKILRTARAHGQGCQRRQEAVQNAIHEA